MATRQRKIGEPELAEEQKKKVQAALRKRSRGASGNRAYYIAIGAVTALLLGAIAVLIVSPDKGLFGTPVLDNDLIESHNGRGESWTAGRNDFFENWSLGDAKKIMGVQISQQARMLPPCESMLQETLVPPAFDARQNWPSCVTPVMAQGNCSSSWATTAVSSLSDRFCIVDEENADLRLSAQDLLSCDKQRNMGCEGGFLDTVWEHLEQSGVVDEECFPYAGDDSLACDSKCAGGKIYKASRHCAVAGEAAIQREIMNNGPVTAAILVYTDFLTYKGGIYKHSQLASRFSQGHAVKIVGWGADETSGTKYWIVQNSWGTSWGENGYARVVRGEGEAGIEDFALAGTPAVEESEDATAAETTTETADETTEETETNA